MSNWQYRLENLSIWFQGGVRRSFLIFAGIVLVLLAPTYFLGILASNFWFNTPSLNSRALDFSLKFRPKEIQEQEWIISDTQIVPLANKENTLYISINNKANPSIGYFPFVYTLQVLDANGRILSQEKKVSYLLPAEVKFISINTASAQAAKLNLIRENETRPVYYNPNNQVLKQPDIRLVSQNLRDITYTPDLEISAVFKNEDKIKIGRVDILYLIRDAQQSVVGIGEYSFENFLPQTEREIKLRYPKPDGRSFKFLDIRWTVNYLDQKNLSPI